MGSVTTHWPLRLLAVGFGLAVVVAVPAKRQANADPAPPADPARDYPTTTVPLLKRYCLDCHSTKLKKGHLDLERFATVHEIRHDLKPWTMVIEQLEAGEMPPKGKPQPTADERQQLVAWVRGFLDAEARARAGDPGHVPLRRLSNAEYDATVRDLTGVDLRPAREFPADGAAGEGFTNAAEGLAEMSPTLLNKYLAAAKELADHAVLLPDGFRFSVAKTRRDWTNEGTAALRRFYAEYATGDGTLRVQPYLLATVRHRPALAAGRFDEVAAKEKLNARYLRVLWEAITDRKPSEPLDAIRTKWRAAGEKDVPALAAEVAAWQSALWRTVKVGNYVQASWNAASGYQESLTRQVPVDPPAADTVPLRVSVKPVPGQSEVVVYLTAREAGTAGTVVWGRPRFEGPGKPALLLRDYPDYGPAFEADNPTAFAGTAKYLAAVVVAANDPKANVDDLAKRHGLDPAFLKNWVKVLAVPPRKAAEAATRPAVELTLLDDKTPPNAEHKFISGWKKKGTDLPVFLANASGQTEMIPGRVSGYGVAMHPMPDEFVAVVWKSPVAGQVKVAARVTHAHPACGNGVAWFVEHRRGNRATLLGEGAVDLGKEAKPPAKVVTVEKGDTLVLAVDARDGNHVCDMTEVGFTVTEVDMPGRSWDLAGDVWSNVQTSNPHADKHGNADTWSFVRGPSKGRTSAAAAPGIPADSVLGRWRLAASDVTRQLVTAMLAVEAEKLLTGPRPADEKNPDRAVYDRLVTGDGPLFAGLDVTKLAKPRPKGGTFGLPRERFGTGDSLSTATDAVVEVRLPAALFVGRDFVVDARLDGPAGDRLVRVRAATTPPGPRWDGPVLAVATGAGYRELTRGHADFRRVFPLYICFPIVVPSDEVVTLKMFHREDDALVRMFLDADQVRRLDRLWAEQRFISRQPAAEYAYLPQFMGFTTQDTPKEFQQFFIDRKPLFKKHAEEFEAEEEAAIPKQLDALLRFADRAYRRTLTDNERGQLLALYDGLRKKGVTHGEAFRGVLSRVFVAPSFLFHVEYAPPGKDPKPVNDYELASRLSYFLWSSMPDDELRRLAAAGKLRDPNVLAAQVQRLLNDPRVRNLAIEFGTQWIHVRGFEDLKEKNENLFPAFDAKMRQAISEESILFFQDFFRENRPVTALLDADYAYVNELLAKHYGIPGVSGSAFRRVDGVRRFGRGGILGLASVQTKEAGASRTSPVLRGNWVVETLLGEKLPKPPPNVPQLPESETGTNLTMRQLTERHTKEESCAACHVRIDPFGFAFEKYDPIGRYREKDANGLAVDTHSKLKDGTEFEGLDGLRNYLLTKKKDVIVRLFCRRLLGYALGRAVTLSDQTLVDEMAAGLMKPDGKVQAAVQAIVRSPQFRMIRGSEFEN